MSLTGATLLFALGLLAVGGYLALAGERMRNLAISSLRNRGIALGVLVITSVWFLWKVLHLGESDFGNYRNYLFIGFLAVAVGSWFYTPDFLGVRMLAAFYLLCSGLFLNAAFGHYDIASRLFLVTAVYVGIGIALYLAAAPFRLRDALQWLFAKPLRSRVLGGALAGYGLLLVVVAIAY